MTIEKTPPLPKGDVPSQAPAPAAAPPPPTVKAAPRPKPSFHVYSRQRDQHVVGPGCWCMPKFQVVEGRKIVVHKRD